MDALPLICRAASAPVSRRKCFLRFLGAALIILNPAFVSAEVDVPERPADYLMDRGEVLSPEKAREVSAALNACARDYDIHIYIMTLPTLSVMPSRAREKLDGMLVTAKSKWLEGKAGALIIFDYETGGASMAESVEARRIFSIVSINLIFDDPHLHYSRKTRSSDQLERAAATLIERFSNLRMQANEKARRLQAEQRVFAGIAGGALLLVIATAVAKMRFPPPQDQSPRSDSRVTADD